MKYIGGLLGIATILSFCGWMNTAASQEEAFQQSLADLKARCAEIYGDPSLDPIRKKVAVGSPNEHWSEIIGRKMHEVIIGTNAYYLHLVFADIRYAFLGHEPKVQLPKDYPLKATEITKDGGVF